MLLHLGPHGSLEVMLWCSRKLVTPLECALTKNAPANPLESALTISLDLKPFGMNRCKKGWGDGGVGLPGSKVVIPSPPRRARNLSERCLAPLDMTSHPCG